MGRPARRYSTNSSLCRAQGERAAADQADRLVGGVSREDQRVRDHEPRAVVAVVAAHQDPAPVLQRGPQPARAGSPASCVPSRGPSGIGHTWCSTPGSGPCPGSRSSVRTRSNSFLTTANSGSPARPANAYSHPQAGAEYRSTGCPERARGLLSASPQQRLPQLPQLLTKVTGFSPGAPRLRSHGHGVMVHERTARHTDLAPRAGAPVRVPDRREERHLVPTVTQRASICSARSGGRTCSTRSARS